MKKTLRVGLIGFGMIGKVHAYCYAALPYYAPDLGVSGKIVAVATNGSETAKRAKETIGCECATTNYRDIVDDPDIDVVHVCSPNAEHLPHLLGAIAANKHVYCEKPIVANAKDAAALREALGRRDERGEPAYRGVSQVAFHLRGFTAIKRAKELIDEGRLGQIVQYRVGYYHSSSTSPLAPFRWKHDSDGGTILDLGSHLFDLIDYLVGLPEELIASATTLVARRPTRALQPSDALDAAETRAVLSEDSVSILTRGLDAASRAKRVPARATSAIYEYPPNARCEERDVMPLAVADSRDRGALSGVIEATKTTTGAEDELRLEINGTRGSLRFNLMNPHYLEYYDAESAPGVYGGEAGWRLIPSGGRYSSPESEFPSPKSTQGWARAHVSSLATFYRSIELGRALGPDFSQALRVQDALESVKRSVKTRAWERV